MSRARLFPAAEAPRHVGAAVVLAALLLPWLGVALFLGSARGTAGLALGAATSLALTAAGLAVAAPVALIAAALVFEYPTSRAARATKLVVDLLAGLPTLLFGAVAAVIFARTGGEAGPIGALALAIFPTGFALLPRLFRGALRALHRVPQGYREAALALGATRARALLAVVVPSARRDLAVAVLVAAAHGVGELGPVLFLGERASPLPVRVLAAGLTGDRGAAAAAGLTLVLAMLTFQALAALVHRRPGAPSEDRRP